MFDAEVKTTEPMTVAFIPMQGVYSQVPEALGRVYGWVAQHGLMPAGMPSAVYFTDPNEIPETEAVWEVRAPIEEDLPESVPDESGCGVKHIPPQKVASTTFRGPYEGLGSAYDSLAEWITGNGLHVVGPPEEVYFSDPAETPPEEYLTEVRFPVI